MRRWGGRARLPNVTAVTLDSPEVLAGWRAMQSAGHVRSPFLTWQWATALAAVPEVSAALRVLQVTDGARTVGLLPVEHWRRSDGLRVLGLAGGEWLGPDHVDVVAAPADRASVATAVARHLVRLTSWDLLDFEGLSRDGALVSALASLRPPRVLRLHDREVTAPYVDLGERDPAALLPRRNLRQQVGRGLRMAQRSGGGLSVSTQPSEVLAHLPTLMRLHDERFQGVSQVFATPERRRFHMEAAGRLAEHRMARIYRLEVDGQDAALLYALGLGDRLYYYSMGMRPEVGLSPGRTLLGQVVLAAAAEGFAEFDLLRGDHEFKLRFASGSRSDLHLRLLRPTPNVLREMARRLPARAHGRFALHGQRAEDAAELEWSTASSQRPARRPAPHHRA